MKNSPQPSEQNERRTQHAQIKNLVGKLSEQQILLDYLIDAGFVLEEAVHLLDLREHLYANAEMQQLMADDARMQFDVRFYMVSILFIIFDLEVAFLFPWAAAFKHLGDYAFWSMMVFLALLTIGFIYEWKKGALEWD